MNTPPPARVGDLDVPERRKRYTSSREEEVDPQMYPCGKAIESRTHIVGGREVYTRRNGMR